MKNVNTWSLFKTYRWRLNSIVLGNILSNIPRGMFQGLAYFVILKLSIPIITNMQRDFMQLWRL